MKRQKTARNSKTAYIKKRTVLQQAWNNLLAKYTEEMCTWRTNSNDHVVSLDLLHSELTGEYVNRHLILKPNKT